MGTKQDKHLKKLNMNQQGKDNRNWKGGRYINCNGYVMVYAPLHPRANKNYVFEHILVAEKYLGRFIKNTEVVHHKDGDKKNNKPENLEVMIRNMHISFHKKKYWNKKRGLI